jgi:hypothetical protein
VHAEAADVSVREGFVYAYRNKKHSEAGIGGEVWGRPAARGGDVATSRGGGATQRHSLGTCQADGAPVAVEEDTGDVMVY